MHVPRRVAEVDLLEKSPVVRVLGPTLVLFLKDLGRIRPFLTTAIWVTYWRYLSTRSMKNSVSTLMPCGRSRFSLSRCSLIARLII